MYGVRLDHPSHLDCQRSYCSCLLSLKSSILWILEQCLSLLLGSLYIAGSRVRKSPVSASLRWSLENLVGWGVLLFCFFSWLNLQTSNKCTKPWKSIINAWWDTPSSATEHKNGSHADAVSTGTWYRAKSGESSLICLQILLLFVNMQLITDFLWLWWSGRSRILCDCGQGWNAADARDAGMQGCAFRRHLAGSGERARPHSRGWSAPDRREEVKRILPAQHPLCLGRV